MSREQSNILKGVGILMMLYLHLFQSVDQVPVECLGPYYGRLPLLQKLTRLAAPVAVFLMITGYGLMCKHLNGTLTLRGNARKLPKLYLPYVIVTLLAASIATWLSPGNYFADGWEVLANLTGWHTTFNLNAWFLLPYVLLMLLSPWLCRFVHKARAWVVIAAALACHVASSLYMDFAPDGVLAFWPLTFFFMCLNLVFSFVLGGLLRLAPAPEDSRLLAWAGRKAWVALLALCVIMLHLPGIWKPLYAFLFIPLLGRVSLPAPIRKSLLFLGRYSMCMWFVHGYLYCGDIVNVYELRHPVLIYVALVAGSLAVSIVIDNVAGFCLEYITKAKEKYGKQDIGSGEHL